jgi:hypothetical protein
VLADQRQRSKTFHRVDARSGQNRSASAPAHTANDYRSTRSRDRWVSFASIEASTEQLQDRGTLAFAQSSKQYDLAAWKLDCVTAKIIHLPEQSHFFVEL